jgi:3-deoxy-7-phosphoheptulonate synthase
LLTQVIIIMRPQALESEIDIVVQRLKDHDCDSHVSRGATHTVIGVVGDTRSVFQAAGWERLPGVEKVVRVMESYKLVSRKFQPESTIITVRGVSIGEGSFTAIAGPCAVETRDQLFRTAEAVKKAGASVLRGDAFKPRTSPYAFQGLGEEGLQYLAEAREEFDMPFVAEVLDPRDVELVASYADILRVGTRNMANYTLLQEIGQTNKPVQLKRGFTATIDEWLNAAEYIFKSGNPRIIMVERGIRTFETASRNTLDITAVPLLKHISHLPVMVDPSHSGGRRELVAPLSRAGLAAGADGIMVDVHPEPDTAKVDGAQALLPEEFAELMVVLRKLAAALDITIT